VCTATWIRWEDGYEVFFNRDELRTRKPAQPPAELVHDGVRCLAPVDGDAGGTWIGVNEFGVTIGLANGPAGPVELPERPFRSRGLLVLDLLASRSAEDAARRLGAIDPSLYRPFSLFALDAGREPELWSSDGTRIGPGKPASEGALLFSSSRDAERARSERQALLRRMILEHGGLDPALLEGFHASHLPERGAFSPCMHREDAGTLSTTRVRVGTDEVELAYAAGPPCERPAIVRRRLRRQERGVI